MSKFSVPKQARLSQINIDTFLGADLTNEAGYISLLRSPNCQNMIRESSGKVRKWIGYHTIKQYDGPINACHIYYSENADKVLYHAGTKLYDGDTVVYNGIANSKSQSKQLNGKLYIFDGQKLLVYYKNDNNYECVTAESIAYIPTIFISKSPKGGGEPYEPINLIQPKKTESFLGNDTDTVYQLAATEIESIDKVVEVTKSGENVLSPNKDYSVNLELGTVTFTSAKKPVVAGEDNIKITYSKNIKGYVDRINKCDICTLYGVNGARDRVFCAGNKEFGNRDYYSQIDNGLFFGDVWYTVCGADNSNIIGYTIINDSLATHLDRSDDDTNIILRKGSVAKGEAAFALSGSYQGSGAICKHSFGVLETEPLFLTKNGIFAVTPSDVLGERFAQNRSYYLNGLLLKQDLENAYACIYNGFYMLACGEYIFALDGTQTSREKNDPYSNRQYAGFYRTGVNACCIWVQGNDLMFGCTDGKIKKFYNDYENVRNFNDDGAAILAKWTTPYILGNNFYMGKQFKKFHALLASYSRTGCNVVAMYDGIKEIVYIDEGDFCFTTLFETVDFDSITFLSDQTPKTLTEKMNIKPENNKAQFIIENGEKNEALGIYNVAIQFIEK